MALTQVSTAGVKDDAVTSGKIPANAVGASELADNAVDTAAIADDAVTTAKIAADAVTGAKIADDAIDSEHYTDGSIDTAHIANGAVTTNKIADNQITSAKIVDQAVTLAKLEHGTSSNDGKFLRANNGADPTFETVTGTTINNNADNRVITGSGTANTLEGESNVHVVSDRLLIGTDTLQTLNYTTHGAIQTLGAYNTSSINITNNENSGNTSALTFNKIRGASGGVSASDNMGGINWAAYDGSAWRSGITVEGKLTGSGSNNVPSKLTFKINSGSSNTERFAITPNGVTFNGDTAAANALDDYEEGTYTATITGQSAGSIALYGTEDTLAYTKIGNVVHVHGRVRLYIVNNSMSGQARVSLPFTAAAGTEASVAGMSSVATHGVSMDESSDIGMFLEGAGSTSNGYLTITRYNQSWTAVTANQFGGTGATSNDYLAFNHTYQAA